MPLQIAHNSESLLSSPVNDLNSLTSVTISYFKLAAEQFSYWLETWTTGTHTGHGLELCAATEVRYRNRCIRVYSHLLPLADFA